MKFMLLIYNDERLDGKEEGEEHARVVAKHRAFAAGLGKKLVDGAGLRPTATATTVRSVKGVQCLHPGPFETTKEQLGGYYLIDVADLDAALAVAKQVPLSVDGSIEVRPVIQGQ